MTLQLSTLSLGVFLMTILSFTTAQSVHATEQAYIQVRNALVQSEPKLLARTLKKLSYANSVTVLETSGSWVQVQLNGKATGYIHKSAITSRVLTLSHKSLLRSSVDHTDLSLAGKGFSLDVEKQLAKNDQSLNFNAVDSMEKLSISQSNTVKFVKDGKLIGESLN